MPQSTIMAADMSRVLFWPSLSKETPPKRLATPLAGEKMRPMMVAAPNAVAMVPPRSVIIRPAPRFRAQNRKKTQNRGLIRTSFIVKSCTMTAFFFSFGGARWSPDREICTRAK